MGGEKKFRKLNPKASNKIPPSAAPPPWVQLPGDVTANILQRLGAEEMLRTAQRVCKTWWKACQDPAVWRVISLYNHIYENTEHETICRRAVDRSQGQLLDLTIYFFGNDKLIKYVAQRSRNLKRLILQSCFGMSGTGLVRAVEGLPHLIELHLTLLHIPAEDVEAIGFSCPNLNSFSYDEHGSKVQYPSDYEDNIDESTQDNVALAVGKSMPNLRHLRLFANEMSNEGLKAILEGCPHLESLDIRQCFGIHLGGDVGKRCRERIKDLKLPSDSVGDVYWLVNDPSECNPYRSYDSGWCSSDTDSNNHGDSKSCDSYKRHP